MKMKKKGDFWNTHTYTTMLVRAESRTTIIIIIITTTDDDNDKTAVVDTAQ
jgi:hypothetical protein